jgi:tetratricopeptide (TPR) repeat protein
VAADAWKLRLPDSGRDELLRPFEDNCRLFRKPDGALFEGTPFPRIEPGLSGLGWRILDAPVRIENDPARGEGAVARRRHTLHRVEEALAKKPGDHRLQYQLGLLCLYLEDFESAEPVLRASIRPTGAGLPKDEQAAALSRLSDLAMNRNDLLQAVRDARAALALVPELVRPRYVLATAAYRQQHFAEASAEYRRILNAPGGADSAGLDRAEVSRELGVCLYRAEKFDEAAEAFAFVVAARSADALSRLFLGNALAHLGRFESAYHAFEEAIAIDPELTDARGNLEVMALELGYRLFDTGRASEALALVPEWTRHTELLFLKAIALHALKDLAGARRSLEFLNGLDDNFAEAHWNLALVCRELGDVAAARAALLRFRQLAPGDTRARALEEALSG